MLESRPLRGWAAPPSVTIANSSGANVDLNKVYSHPPCMGKTAAGNPLSLPASTSAGCRGAVCKGGMGSAAHGNGSAAARSAAPPSTTTFSANADTPIAETEVGAGTFSSTTAAATLALPQSEEEVTNYVLYDGLPHVGPASRRAQQRQSEAYYRFQHRIHERTEAAHALILSANPLSLSVMDSQLRLYRWRVTQAQTLTEATSILQDYVVETAKHGYRVRRRAPPLRQSRYAHGRGRATLKQRAQEELERLGLKDTVQDSAGASADGTRMGRGVIAARRHPNDSGASDRHPDQEAEEEEEEGLDDAALEDDVESALPPPPPDTLPRLVLVDAFTHEDLGDIARHVRFVDQEYGLEMLLVLLLPNDAGMMTVSMQGAGFVVTPTHHITMEDAYAAGYDLVLAHSMDNLLVDFFTSEFVSSVGRWRNDVRSKAAVGNYMSLRSVLLGGLDMDALQRLAWDNRVDDAGVLEVLGAQSLSTQGGAQRYGEASRNLLQQQGGAEAEVGAKCSGSGASRCSRSGSVESDADLAQSRGEPILGVGVPRLRRRPTSVAHFGVRLPANQHALHEPILSFSTKRDVFASVMTQEVYPWYSHSRRRCHTGEVGDGAGGAEDDVDVSKHQQHLLQEALEKELGRLLAENESKQASIDAMQEEVERLHRTVAVLRRHQSGAPGAAGDGVNAKTLPERPDSGSTVHLSKQQQVYILKERLEMANDRIMTLLKGGRPSGAPTSPRRRGGRRFSGGSRRPGGGRAGSTAQSPEQTSRSRTYSPLLINAIVREAEQMTALDSDANFSLTQLELHLQEMKAASNNAASKAAAGQKQRREREAADRVIRSLQLELMELQGRLDDTDFGNSQTAAESSDGLQARMAGRLQAALEVLEAQTLRIRHLEELRQMDQLLLSATLSQEGAKGQKKKGAGSNRSPTAGIVGASDNTDDGDRNSSSSADGDEVDALASRRGAARGHRAQRPRATSKKAAKPRFGIESVPAGKKGVAGSGAGAAASTHFTKGGANAVKVIDSDSTQREGMEEAVARHTEAAVQDAVTSLQGSHRQQLAALLQVCKMQLTRVVLKLQKPSTSAYAALLQEELSRAEQDRHSAWMRLQFTLNGLAPDQYDATLANGALSSAAAAATAPLGALTAMVTPGLDATDIAAAAGPLDGANAVPIGAVTDPQVRCVAASIAREYAAYGLRVAYMTSELQRVKQAMMTSQGHQPESAAAAMPVVADVPPEQLLSACQAAKTYVQATIEACGSTQAYLEAVQAELVTEQQLRPWCDVKSQQLFSAAHTTPSPSCMVLVPSTLHLAASTSSAAGTQNHALDNTPPSMVSSSDDQVMLLADVDASMRDVADVYATLLRALTPKISGAAVCNSTPASGSEKRASKWRRRPVVSPTQSKATGPQQKAQRQSVATPADKSADDSPDELDSLLPLHQPAGPTMEAAMAMLPLHRDGVAGYQGQLNRLYTAEGAHSVTQRRLYEAILRAYQQHRIHPVHMAAVEYAVGLPLLDLRRSDGGIAKDRSSESLTSEGEVPVDLIFAQAGAAHAQHREVIALLELITPTTARGLRALTRELRQMQGLLDREDDEAVFAGALNGTGPPCTSPVFLSAVDAAVLGCVVDELRWRQWQHSVLPSKKDSKDSSDPVPLSAAGAAPSELVTALMLARRHKSRGDSSSTPTEDGGPALEDARGIAHYMAFCAAPERAAGNARSKRRSSVQGSSGSQASEAEDLFHLTDVPLMPSNASGTSPLAAAGSDDSDVGLKVAHELAALFSKRHPQSADGGDDGAAAMLADIYLDDDEGGGAGKFGGDSNKEAMRSIRRELEYLQAVKQQRMWELMMRFELQKERSAGNDSSGSRPAKWGVAGAHSGDGGALLPSIDPDRLTFEVKSGSPAWYGMEAAKRVHNILRRRARPDQIIVGGGPHGGSVGIELSRRTAQPAPSTAGSSKTGNVGSGLPSPEDEGYARSSGEEEALYTLRPYASNQQPNRTDGRATPSIAPLPPLRQHGLSRAQQWHATRAGGVAAHCEDQVTLSNPYTQDGSFAGHGYNTTLMAAARYLSPRDVLSLNAYGHMTSGGAYDYSDTNQPLYTAGGLIDQVLAYREALMHAAGRVVPMPSSTYANGAPYCLPLSSSSAPSRQVGVSGNHPYDPQDRQPPSPVPLPEVTSWVYGVPETHASSLVQQQIISSQQQQDTLLFMPRYDRSLLAEVEGRQRARVPPAVPSALVRGHGFLAGAAAGASPYTTPAALAAQRLQAMLSVSMGNPSIATAGRGTALLPTRGYTLHPQRCDSVAAAPPLSSESPSTKQALARANAASAGVDSTVPSSQTSLGATGGGEVWQPHCESFAFDGKDPNLLDRTLGPQGDGPS
ncbi:hypothetical_protein (plasmid) [Leishmania braziliensis MHOM/BR/75/M2904]|nr:hypothetical_protein [Leishmania braziliensis MHOM/BR/75/M2904]